MPSTATNNFMVKKKVWVMSIWRIRVKMSGSSMELFEALLIGGIDEIILSVLGLFSRSFTKGNYIHPIPQEKIK